MEMKAQKEYTIELKLSIREISILQALFGLPGLNEHLGSQFAEYKEPSKKLFKELSDNLGTVE